MPPGGTHLFTSPGLTLTLSLIGVEELGAQAGFRTSGYRSWSSSLAL